MLTLKSTYFQLEIPLLVVKEGGRQVLWLLEVIRMMITEQLGVLFDMQAS